MKTFLSLLFLIGIIPIQAQEQVPVPTIPQALRTGKIAKLELNKATFEHSLAVIRADWKRQHPTLDFPVSLAEYDRDQGYAPLITMSLHEVPFIKALQYIGEASRRRLIQRSDLLTLQEQGLIVEDWITKSHPASEGLLVRLGLGKSPTNKDLAAAYSKFGVELDDWMTVSYHDGSIMVFAFEPQQEQIAGINFLLSRGYKIIKGEPDGAEQPATHPESKSETGDKPSPVPKPDIR